MHLPDPRAPSVRANIPLDAGKRMTPLSTNGAAMRNGQLDRAPGNPAQLIDTIRIQPWLLAMPTEEEVDLSRSAAGTGVPRQFAHLSLQIADQNLVLWIFGVTQDKNLRHVSAAITNIPESSALFTVTEDERVFGTIITPNQSYRVLPISSTEQAIYRLQGRVNGKPARDEAVPLSQLTKQHQEVQRRHLQALKIAEMQFEFVHFRQDGNTFSSRGGRLGRFTPETATSEDVTKLLSKVGALTNVEQLGKFHIVDRGKHHVRFEQLINGIPVAQRNEITTTPDGSVNEIRLLLTDPARAPTGAPIPKAEAMFFGTKAYAAGAAEDVEFTSEPKLIYEATPESVELLLVYKFTVRRPNRHHSIVRVNAITGEAKIEDANPTLIIQCPDSSALARHSAFGAPPVT